MPYFSRVTFLKNDTEMCAASMTPRPICYETTTSSSTVGCLGTHLRNIKMVTNMLFSRCHHGASTVKVRTKPSRSNCGVRIKRCGHGFCFDCLETWVRKKNTCPMCRDRLFFDAKHDKNIDSMSQGGMEPWVGLREDGDMCDVNESAIRGTLDDESNLEGGRPMQDHVDDKEMHTERRHGQVEAMLGMLG